MRKTYSKSFKTQICLQVLSKEKTVGSVSKGYGIARPIISRWFAEYKRYGMTPYQYEQQLLREIVT